MPPVTSMREPPVTERALLPLAAGERLPATSRPEPPSSEREEPAERVEAPILRKEALSSERARDAPRVMPGVETIPKFARAMRPPAALTLKVFEMVSGALVPDAPPRSVRSRSAWLATSW